MWYTKTITKKYVKPDGTEHEDVIEDINEELDDDLNNCFRCCDCLDTRPTVWPWLTIIIIVCAVVVISGMVTILESQNQHVERQRLQTIQACYTAGQQNCGEIR